MEKRRDVALSAANHQGAQTGRRQGLHFGLDLSLYSTTNSAKNATLTTRIAWGLVRPRYGALTTPGRKRAVASIDQSPPFPDAHAALLRNGALQFDLPSGAPPVPAAPHTPLSFGFGHIDLVWLLAALAAALVVGLAIAYWRGRLPSPAEPASQAPAASPALAPATARLALDDADRLAAEGRHLDAARALLACGLDAIADRYPGLLRPTTTSRDLAGETALPGAFRAGFARIARAVEVGLFGGRPVGPEDYAVCRRAFVTSALGGAA